MTEQMTEMKLDFNVMNSATTTYCRLGDYIRQVDVRNRDLKLTTVQGINIGKYFFPSVANLIGTDLSKYKLVQPDQFACNFMHVGRDEKIPVARNSTSETLLVSSAYFTFKVFGEAVIPEYLELVFKNPNFDREAWFHTDADVRSGLGWNDFCDLQIPVPPIEEQREIVARHKAIEHKIDVNRRLIAKLEETARTIYRHTFVENIDPENLPDGWRLGTLGEIADITMGQSPDGDCLNLDKNGIYFYQGSADFGFRFVTPRVYTTEYNRFAKEYDILMSVRAPVGDLNITRYKCAIGRGVAAMNSRHNTQAYLYYTLLEIKPYMSNDDGTVFGSINKDELFNFEIIVPPGRLIHEFQNCVDYLEKQIDGLDKEVAILIKLENL